MKAMKTAAGTWTEKPPNKEDRIKDDLFPRKKPNNLWKESQGEHKNSPTEKEQRRSQEQTRSYSEATSGLSVAMIDRLAPPRGHSESERADLIHERLVQAMDHRKARFDR